MSKVALESPKVRFFHFRRPAKADQPQARGTLAVSITRVDQDVLVRLDVGLSMCHEPLDQFSRKVGRAISLCRLNTVQKDRTLSGTGLRKNLLIGKTSQGHQGRLMGGSIIVPGHTDTSQDGGERHWTINVALGLLGMDECRPLHEKAS